MVNVPLISELTLNESESFMTREISPNVNRNTQRADAIFSGTLKLLHNLGWNGLIEVNLANNRRADILAINHKGEILIIEVKSCLADFSSDEKWPEYEDYCDYFLFAVDQEFPTQRLPDETGFIIADAFGGAIIREAAHKKLSGPRRKSITLKFARLAAKRLYQSLTPPMA